jgi:3-isopropylmalate dehydrogenase
VISAVDKVLKEGYRTRDIADGQTASDKVLGTEAIGEQVLKHI